MEIKDGTGTGYKVKVTDENMLRAFAQVESKISHASHCLGLAFSWSNATYDYAAGDTILLVKNTSTSKKLLIERIYVGGDTATVATIHFPTGVTPTGTAVTGVNLNRNSGEVAKATAIGDETDNSQGDIFTNVYIGAAETKELKVDGAIVLGVNDCIAIDFVTDGTAAYCSIEGYYFGEG